LKSFDTVLTDARELIRVLDKKIAAAMAEIDQPWEHEQKFVETEAKVKELEALLNKDKNEKDTHLPAPVPTPAFARKVISQKRDTAGEVQSALDAIKAMMTNPAIVARFAGDADILTVTGLDELSKEIEQKQALFDFGTASLLQLDLFGGSVAPATKKSRRH